MKKAISIISILAAASVTTAWAVLGGTPGYDDPRVCFADKCYRVEVARTEQEHDTGLMFRKVLEPDRGMLFVFEKDGLYRFWMKNTLIPLDIVWIDSQNKIVFISKNTPPCVADPCASYGPLGEARYVLEINAGQADRVGAKIGDAVVIEQ